jgi:hypothetical protein
MRSVCFEPITCAIALSTLEHVMRGPRRACPRAKLWLRRAPSDLLLDATLGEISDALINTLNLIDSHSVPGTGAVVVGLLLLALGHLIVTVRAPPCETRDVALGIVVKA